MPFPPPIQLPRGPKKLILRIIWGANAAAIFIYYLVTLQLNQPVKDELSFPFFKILFFIGLVSYVIGYFIEQKHIQSLQQSTQNTDTSLNSPDQIVSRWMIVFAFTEAPAVVGMVYYLLSGKRDLLLILGGLSIFFFIYYFFRFKDYDKYL